MKILHVLYAGLGGHGNVFFSMEDADIQKKYVNEALFNGVEYVREEYIEQCKRRGIQWHYVHKKPGLHLGYYRELYRAIKKTNPQLIFLHGGAAVLPAWLYKRFNKSVKRIIVRETQANHLKTKIDWLYLSMAMFFADEMVYLSNEYKTQVKEKFPRLFKESHSHVIPNGIDLTIYKPLQENINVNKEVRLGMQSRLIPIKDHITLIHAFDAVQKKLNLPVILYIAGEGEYKNVLIDLVNKLGLNKKIIFTGLLNEPQLVEFLSNIDIYIHASLGETMSTAIMQAMACKKAIIASDVPGINNMIKHDQTGILVKAQNISEMESSIMRLITNKHLAENLAKNAFDFATENYSNTTMFAKYSQLFDQ